MAREITPPPPRDDSSPEFQQALAAARARGPDAMLLEAVRIAQERPHLTDAQVAQEASRNIQRANQRPWWKLW